MTREKIASVGDSCGHITHEGGGGGGGGEGGLPWWRAAGFPEPTPILYWAKCKKRPILIPSKVQKETHPYTEQNAKKRPIHIPSKVQKETHPYIFCILLSIWMGLFLHFARYMDGSLFAFCSVYGWVSFCILLSIWMGLFLHFARYMDGSLFALCSVYGWVSFCILLGIWMGLFLHFARYMDGSLFALCSVYGWVSWAKCKKKTHSYTALSQNCTYIPPIQFYFYAPVSNDRGYIVSVMSVCLFVVCLFVCLSVVNFNLRYNFWTVRDGDFIYGMHTPLMTPFQMTPRSMTFWPWLWSWT